MSDFCLNNLSSKPFDYPCKYPTYYILLFILTSASAVLSDVCCLYFFHDNLSHCLSPASVISNKSVCVCVIDSMMRCPTMTT